MKNIYVLVHDDAGQEARLQAALDLTRAVEGHLSCIDVIQLPVQVGDIYGFGAQSQVIEAEREQEAANRGAIEARLIREGVSWNWVQAVGDIAPSMNQLSDLADVIILNRKLDKALAPDMQGIAAAVMLGSHKPILAVPENSRGCNVSGNAVIAWDGSSEAATALRAAVPLLKLASSIAIVVVDEGSIRSPATEAASYLSRYGIDCEIVIAPRGDNSVPTVLLDQVRGRRADYMVMGGYGHSRVAEALFRGVTRHMLANCPVPLLLAH